jgi:hypothetical protein
MNIQFIPYIFTGSLPNLGKGPYGFDSESITLKPQFFGDKCYNKAAEVCLVSGLPDYSCFFHAFIWHSPKNILSYNTFISGLTEKKLRNAANFRFVRNQLQMILNFSNPLIVGCNINSDFKSLEIIYKNIFDLHSFFNEFNENKTGVQPISLRRLVFKFFQVDIQNNSHDCISDALHSVKIYEEIYLQWKTVKYKFNLNDPPFEYLKFPFPS